MTEGEQAADAAGEPHYTKPLPIEYRCGRNQESIVNCVVYNVHM